VGEIVQGGAADRGLELVGANLVALEVADGDLVIDVADALDELIAGFGGCLDEAGGDLAALGLVTLFAAEPPPALLDEVNAAIEVGFGPTGIWRGTGFAPRRSTIMSTVRQKSAPVRSILLTKATRGTA